MLKLSDKAPIKGWQSTPNIPPTNIYKPICLSVNKSLIMKAGNKAKKEESSIPAQNIAKNTKGDIVSIENFILEDCSGIITWLTNFFILIRLIILNPTSIMHTIKGILLDVPNTPTINGPSANPVVTDEL